MPVNSLIKVNQLSTSAEDVALQSMTQEFVQIFGVDLWYFKRTAENVDIILGEDPTSKFEEKYNIEMYLQTFNGFEGSSDLYSKFGFDIDDEVIFEVAIKTWKEIVHSKDSYLFKPREGDLIFYPISNQLFEILHVEDEAPHYAMGKRSVYQVKAKHFDYSHESIDTTNIDEVEIDNVQEIQGDLDNIFDLVEKDSLKLAWTDVTAYAANDKVIDYENNVHYYAEGAGTSGTTNPFLDDPTGDVIDNDITWKRDTGYTKKKEDEYFREKRTGLIDLDGDNPFNLDIITP